MLCADVQHLRPFKEIYKRDAQEGFTIAKSNGPFFFRNHPIDYVTIVGCVRSVVEIDIEGSKGKTVLIIHSMSQNLEFFCLMDYGKTN